MEAIAGLAFVAVAVLIAWLWAMMKDAAWKAASQKVIMRGAHKAGQLAVGRALTFTTSATGTQVLEKVQAFGWPTQAQSVLTTNVWLQRATIGEIVFVSGSRVGVSFRSALTLTDDGSARCGVYRVLEWKEDGGIVGDYKQMQTIEQRVQSAIIELDAQAAFDRSPDRA